jgi:hypothetical protein
MANVPNSGSGLAPRWERRLHRPVRLLAQAAIAAGDEHFGDDGIAYGVGPRGAALGLGMGLALFGVELGGDLAEAALGDLSSQKARELVRYRRAQSERRAAEARADEAARAEAARPEEAKTATASTEARPIAAAPATSELAELRAVVEQLSRSVAAALPRHAPMAVPDEMMAAPVEQHRTTNGASST